MHLVRVIEMSANMGCKREDVSQITDC